MVKITHATHWKKGGLCILPIKTLSLLNDIRCIGKRTSTVFIIALLLIIKIDGYSQSTRSVHGIFGIQNATKATSRVVFTEADGFGESFYYTEKLPNGKLKVRYTYDKPSVPNPLFITYTYDIAKLPSGDFAVDMLAAMPPFSLYIDTNAVSLSYTGDKIILPNYPTNDSLLPDAKGTFILKMLAINDAFLTYEVSVTNRKFISAGNITLNGKIYEAYKHSYDFTQKNYLDENCFTADWQDTVEETYLVGYGLVNQKRQGTMTFFNEGGVQVMEQVLISELLNIC